MPLLTMPFLSRCLISVALASATLFSNAVFAKASDRDQPLYAEADKLTTDDRTRVSVFVGNVIITRAP